MAIESRLVSKTIESAQTRVEGYNFDIRKRVVEFDDVINKQRETIYAERDKVLRNEDLGETIVGFLDDEIDALIAQYCADELPDEWNLEGLSVAARAIGLDAEGTARTSCGTWAAGRPSASTCASWSTPRWRPRKPRSVRRTGRRRADRPAAHDRQPVGRAPDRAGRHATRHRPARLRPAGSAGRVQARGLQPVRRAARLHPPPGRLVDLPRPGHPPGAAGPPGRCRDRASPWPAHGRVAGAAAPARRGALRRGGGSWRVGGAVGPRPPVEPPPRARRPRRAARLGSIARGLPPAPAVRGVRELLGDEVVGSSSANGSSALDPGFTPTGDEWAATTRAGAAPGSSTRSATDAEPAGDA